jgi:hypothetical protein
MILSSSRTVISFLFLFSAVVVDASSSSSSSDNREAILAVPVSESNTQTRGMAKRPSTTSKGKTKNAPKDDDNYNGLQRFTVQARTTLIMNVDDMMDHLTPAESIFFEDTWMEAFQTVHGEEEEEEENSNSVTVRSVIVEEDEKTKKSRGGDDRRKLRGLNRELWFYNFGGWFDIWAYIDISCNLCGGGGYDDDDHYYNRMLTVFDDEDNGFHHRFETMLCDMLREGPFESFHQLQDCEVAFPF